MKTKRHVRRSGHVEQALRKSKINAPDLLASKLYNEITFYPALLAANSLGSIKNAMFSPLIVILDRTASLGVLVRY